MPDRLSRARRRAGTLRHWAPGDARLIPPAADPTFVALAAIGAVLLAWLIGLELAPAFVLVRHVLGATLAALVFVVGARPRWVRA